MRADLLVFFLIGERTLDFSIIFAVGFSKVPFIKLRKFLYVPNLLIIFFLSEMNVGLCQISLHLPRYHKVFLF